MKRQLTKEDWFEVKTAWVIEELADHEFRPGEHYWAWVAAFPTEEAAKEYWIFLDKRADK